jgi:hypothetical protein
MTREAADGCPGWPLPTKAAHGTKDVLDERHESFRIIDGIRGITVGQPTGTCFDFTYRLIK